MNYDHQEIEKKWQKRWQEDQIYRTPDEVQNKFYSLGMFPYPSGEGLHIGHPKGYTANDIISRYMRSNGYQVLMPMGWDSFGLPAENYAIKTGVHPGITTKKAIDNFRKQLKSIGLSYDWNREISTSDQSYYRWTQWIFIELYKKGLAYQKEAPVNWCPGCQTVLANEQVKDGACDRCGSKVVQKNLKQWFFKITEYAEELLEDLASLDWPESIKSMQANWIGKSRGAQINFAVSDSNSKIQVFTTRPDTLFGVTYLVLAPEHPFFRTHQERLNPEVADYIGESNKKSELDRQSAKEKTGIYSGFKAIHPITQEKIPIWVGDYVLMGYGTGAVMAVPAHDERDWDFAQKYELPIKQVIQNDESEKPYTGHGRLVNSQIWDGLNSEINLDKIISSLVDEGIGKEAINFRLRDWLVSRQRYWGPPIPIVYCEQCGIQAVSESDLPVELPTNVDFKPTGESPLKNSENFKNVKCPSCSGLAKREVDTLDTFVDSSWYFLRFADHINERDFFSRKNLDKWLPVDLYVGGAEHAVLHLLYARFITKALDDIVGLGFREPFKKLKNVGLIRGEDDQKMSKSRGNVINPDKIVQELGADSLRVYEMFMGPFDESVKWESKALVGVRRWLDRVAELSNKVEENYQDSHESSKVLEETIQKVKSDILTFKFNTAISAMMIASNKLKDELKISKSLFERFLKILAPFAPHLSQELWEKIGNVGYLDYVDWPKAQIKEADQVLIVVQVNGRFRGKLTVKKDTQQMEIEEQAKKIEKVSKYINDKKAKAIYVPNKLINFLT